MVGQIRFDQVNIVVRDMGAAVDFYRRLGVEVADAGDDEWQPHHRTITSTAGGVDADLDSAAFAATWNTGWPADRAGVVVGLRVPTREAVDDLYAAVTGAGYRGQQPPYDAFWGARYAVVEDPDGNAIGLMSPQDDAARTTPPDPP